MLTLMRRLRAAFFVPAVLAGGLVLAGCELVEGLGEAENPVVQALDKAVPVQCERQEAVRVGAFVAALDEAVSGGGRVVEAAAPAVAQLTQIRMIGREESPAVIALLYGQIVAAAAPEAWKYFQARGVVYSETDLRGIFMAASERVLANKGSVQVMRDTVRSTPCGRG